VGCGFGDALGLTWADVDPDARRTFVLSFWTIHAHSQCEARDRIRAVDFVFTNFACRSVDYRKVGEAFRVAVRLSGVRADGRLSLHSLRHGYASLLIAEWLDVLFVSCQLGHAAPGVKRCRSIAHLFGRAKHALAARSAIEAGYAAMALSRS
jgi:integrase